MTARIAGDRPERAGSSAPPATSGDTELQSPASGTTTTPSSDTTPETLTSTSSGDTAGKNGSEFESPTSKSSGERSTGSTRRWRQPRNVREFAMQANAVATMVLNGTMDVESARAYSSVARTVAQAMSTEVSRARFIEAEPVLDLSGDVFEDEP